ncbi:hypothetical protein D3C80_687200 [compost metagenome]
MKRQYGIEFSMKCSVCGNSSFEIKSDEEIKCSDCGFIYSKSQLMEENELSKKYAIDTLKKEIKADNKKLKGIFNRR